MTEPTKRDREKARKLVAEIMEIDMRRTADRITVVARALAAARAEERERCAKVAEGLIRDKGKSSSYREGWNHGCETAAIAIRKGE